MKSNIGYLRSCYNQWQCDPHEFKSVGGVFDMQGNQVAQVSESAEFCNNTPLQNEYRNRTAAFIAQAPNMYTKLVHVKMYLETFGERTVHDHKVMIDDIVEILDEALNK